jgi:GT2 family glycosyltransferase
LADIAVIIVNYGTAGLALEAAASVLERDHPGHRVELHLVDNDSPSGTMPKPLPAPSSGAAGPGG